MAIGDVYDRGAKELDKNKYDKPISQYMRNKKGSNVGRLTGYTGLGLKLSGDGRMKSAVVEKPSMADIKRMMAKHGKGLRMSGSEREACKGSGMMNDKFLFADISL